MYFIRVDDWRAAKALKSFPQEVSLHRLTTKCIRIFARNRVCILSTKRDSLMAQQLKYKSTKNKNKQKNEKKKQKLFAKSPNEFESPRRCMAHHGKQCEPVERSLKTIFYQIINSKVNSYDTFFSASSFRSMV